MNWEQLKAYVNEPGRTRPQLERVARTIGLSPDVKGDLLLHNINRRIEIRIRDEGPNAMSGVTLPNSNRNRTNNGGGSQRQTNTPRRQSRSSGQPDGGNQPPQAPPQNNGIAQQTMPNSLVRVAVSVFNPNTDYAILQRIAEVYGLQTNQNFYALKRELLALLDAEAHNCSPQEVHDEVVAWQQANRPTPETPSNNGGIMNHWFTRLAAVTAAAILILVAGLWLYNAFDDNGSTPAGGSDPVPTVIPTTVPTNPTAEPTSSTGGDVGTRTSSDPNSTTAVHAADTYSFPAPSSNLDSMPKVKIDVAPQDTWFHRVFNEALFKAPDWNGADSWFVTLALGRNSGGNWTSHGNPGQIVYRGTSTNINWCVGFLTTAQYKEQFLAGAGNYDVAVNVRIAPNSPVNVITHDGQTKSGVTSDAGDITIILPDSGVTTVCVAYQTAAPTHESLVWWGPYDRSENINTIDAR